MTIRNLLRTLCAFLLAAGAAGAMAQSCTITTAATLSSGTNYNPFAAGFNDTTGAFSITCTRPKGGSNKFPNTFYVGATNGLNYAGATRRLRLGASSSYLEYALYRTATGCTTPWGSATVADVYSLPNANTQGNDVTTSPDPLTSGTSFCFRITGGLNTAPPGTYSDTVQIAVAESPTVIWGTAAVTFQTTIQPACQFLSTPSDMTLAYTSFQPGDATGTTSFELKCTNTTSYTVGFDAASGNLLGLNYTLGVSPPSGLGTGTPQPAPGHTVTATVPGGQAGTCASGTCSSSVTRNVTISY